jgi:hypothetical protein
MNNFKTTLFSIALIAVTFSAHSQSLSTYSPYSRFGLGEVRNRAYANSKAMGGLSQGIRNNAWVNYLNPASYTAQDTMSFVFDVGLEGSTVNYRSGNLSNYNSTGNVHHIAIQFPIGKKFGASAGIQPYSNVGYRVRQTETDPYILSAIGPVKYYYLGSGGITQFYLGGAYEPFKNFSVGANMSYLFGSLEYTTNVVFPDYSTQINTKYLNSVMVRDVVFSLGAQYTFFFGNEKSYKVVAGATLDNETAIGAQNIVFISFPIGGISDTISYKEYPKNTIDLPKNITAGFTLSYKNKFMGGFEYATQDWTDAKFLSVSDSLSKSETFRFGFQYTPNPNDLRSYLKRISYRAGFYHTNTFLQLRDNQIKDYGITFGVGLPFRRTNSSFNLSFELGNKGTLNNNLVQEKYGIINIGFTFYDFWFMKKKYN